MSNIDNLNVEKAMDKYFAKKNQKNTTNQIEQSVINEQIPEHSSLQQMTAEGSVETVGEACDLIRMLLNTAWGSNWGELVDVTQVGEDADKINTPLITYNTNLREVSPGTNVKPQYMQTKNEVINGKNTGDSFKIHRQFFDCIVEFDFYDNSASSTDELMNKFEKIIITYTGFLKRKGIKEIFFLKEIPSKYSLNYVFNVPMRCLLFYVQLERSHTVRVSTMKQIEENIRIARDNSVSFNNETIINKITYKGEK